MRMLRNGWGGKKACRLVAKERLQREPHRLEGGLSSKNGGGGQSENESRIHGGPGIMHHTRGFRAALAAAEPRRARQRQA